MCFFLPRSIEPPTEDTKELGWYKKITRFDPFGTVLFLLSIMSLILALQWGGTKYSWSNPRLIATLTIFSVLFIAWLILQWYEGDNATVPLDVLAQRSVAGATGYTLLASASFSMVVYYLPLWYVSNPTNLGFYFSLADLTAT